MDEQRALLAAEERQIARLERLLGKEAEAALEEFGLGGLLRVGSDAVHTASRESSPSLSDGQEHALPSFLRPPAVPTDDTASSSQDDYELPGLPQDIITSHITRQINRLVETNIEEVATQVLQQQAHYLSDESLGAEVARILIAFLQYEYDQAANHSALLGAFILALRVRSPQVALSCVAHLFDVVLSNEEVLGGTQADESAILVHNVVEVLGFATAFQGAAVTPLGELMTWILERRIPLEVTSEGGRGVLTYLILSPYAYRLLTRIVRVASRLLAKVCPEHYRKVSDSLEHDCSVMAKVAELPTATLDQRRLSTRLQVYMVILSEAYNESGVELESSDLSCILASVDSMKRAARSPPDEYTLKTYQEIVDAGRGASSPSQGLGAIQDVCELNLTVLSQAVGERVFDTHARAYFDGVYAGRRPQLTSVEGDTFKAFCFLIDGSEAWHEDKEAIAAAWASLYGEAAIPEGVYPEVGRYIRNKLAHLQTPLGMQESVDTLLRSTLIRMAIQKVFMLLITLSGDRAYFSYGVLHVLRLFLADGRRNDFRYQLCLCLWDYLADLGLDGRRVSNTARLVAHLIGGEANDGAPGISVGFFKKHLLPTTLPPGGQTASTRKSLSRPLAAFYDVAFVVMLSGEPGRLGKSAIGSDLHHAIRAFGPLTAMRHDSLLACVEHDRVDKEANKLLRRAVFLYLVDFLAAYEKGEKRAARVVDAHFPEPQAFKERAAAVLDVLIRLLASDD